MKVYPLEDSSFWGARLHVGFFPDGRKRWARRSSKVKVDPARVDEHGNRLDKLEAERILAALQVVANEAMAMEAERVDQKRFEEMVRNVLKACGKDVVSECPGFAAFAWPWFERHVEHKGLAQATVRAYRGKLAGFCEWLEDENARLDSIDLAVIQAYYDEQLEFLKATTIANSLKVLRMVFQRAVAERLIVVNPVIDVVRKSYDSVSKSAFTVAEVGRIVAACGEWSNRIEFADEWRDVCRFASVTGARGGDCFGLRAGDFSEVTVADGSRRLRVAFDQSKTSGAVVLLLPEPVAEVFRERLGGLGGSGLVFPNLAALRPGRRGPGARFVEIMDLAGIDYQETPPSSPRGKTQRSHGFHSFRHFVSSELEADSVSRGTNQYVTGHKDARTKEAYITKQLEAMDRECSGTWERVVAVL